MTYTKTNWQNGDTITSTKLNNIENNVQKFLYITRIGDSDIINVSYNDILNALENNRLPIIFDSMSEDLRVYYFYIIGQNQNFYSVTFVCGDESLSYIADSASANLSFQSELA